MKRLLIALLAFLLLQGFAQEPDASVECPPGSHAIAKYHPDDYDGQSFETGFEYGAEYIDIVSMYWGGTPEVYMVTWVVQYDNAYTPISAAFMKAGQDGISFVYDPPKTPQSPPEPITLQSDTYGISHITWCTPSEPTAITLSSFQGNENGAYTGFILFAAGGVIMLLVLLSLALFRVKMKI